MFQLYFFLSGAYQYNLVNPIHVKKYRLNSVLFNNSGTYSNTNLLLATTYIPANPGTNVANGGNPVPDYNIIASIPVITASSTIFYEPTNPIWYDVDKSLYTFKFYLLDPATMQPITTYPSTFNIVLDCE